MAVTCSSAAREFRIHTQSYAQHLLLCKKRRNTSMHSMPRLQQRFRVGDVAASPKFSGDKYFNFRWATVFCLPHKAQNDKIC